MDTKDLLSWLPTIEGLASRGISPQTVGAVFDAFDSANKPHPPAKQIVQSAIRYAKKSSKKRGRPAKNSRPCPVDGKPTPEAKWARHMGGHLAHKQVRKENGEYIPIVTSEK